YLLHLDVSAKLHAISAQSRGVDDISARKLVFELGNTCFLETLLVFGGVILGVFAKIPVFTGGPDFLRNLGPLRLESIQFILEARVAVGGDRDPFHRFVSLDVNWDAPKSKPEPTTLVS